MNNSTYEYTALPSDNETESLTGSHDNPLCLPRCRLGGLPRCLQSGARRFLILLCIAAFGCSMALDGLIGVTTSTLERRYQFPSSKSSWIKPASQVAGLPIQLFVGYVGSSVKRPVWIGVGLVILALGSVVYTLPHFIAPAYDVHNSTRNQSGTLCAASAERDHPRLHEVDAEDASSDKITSDQYLMVFISAAVVMSIGSVPLFVLGTTYIDDSATRSSSAGFDISELCRVHSSLLYINSKNLSVYKYC